MSTEATPTEMPSAMKALFPSPTTPTTPVETLTTETPAPESPTTPIVETVIPVVATPESPTIPVEAPAAIPTAEPDWFLNNETPASTTPVAEIPAAANEYEKKAKTLDDLMARGDLKYILEGALAGKPVKELVNEIQAVDYNTMASEDVAKHYGKMLNYSDDDITELNEVLATKSRFERDQLLSGMRDKLDQAQATRIQSRVGEWSANSQAEQAAQAAKDQFVEKRFQEDVQKEMQFLEGKEWFGAKFTKEDAEDFRKFVTSEFDFIREDGTYDIPKMRNYWLGAKKIQSIQKSNYQTGKTEGTVEVLKAIHRPAESSAGVTRLPEVALPKADKDRAMEVAQGLSTGTLKAKNNQY